jgi:hypothetical protein
MSAKAYGHFISNSTHRYKKNLPNQLSDQAARDAELKSHGKTRRYAHLYRHNRIQETVIVRHTTHYTVINLSTWGRSSSAGKAVPYPRNRHRQTHYELSRSRLLMQPCKHARVTSGSHHNWWSRTAIQNSSSCGRFPALARWCMLIPIKHSAGTQAPDRACLVQACPVDLCWWAISCELWPRQYPDPPGENNFFGWQNPWTFHMRRPSLDLVSCDGFTKDHDWLMAKYWLPKLRQTKISTDIWFGNLE